MSLPASRAGVRSRALALLAGALALLVGLPPAGAQPVAAPTDAGAGVEAGVRATPTSPAPDSQRSTLAQSTAPTPDVYSDTDPAALTYFRPTLDPYGTWLQHPVYGVVWVPDPRYAGADFAPYLSSGHWALTTYGDWVWVSDFPWGWVVFHYGRWVWIGGTGWAWVPGRRYASAWVVWRVPEPGYDYVGWAPMPPAFVWFGGVAFVLRYHPPLPFVFCDSRYVFAHSLRHHVVPHSRLRFVAAHTRRYRRPARSPRMGPPVSRTHVPASAVPRTRVPANPQAVLAARRSTSGRVIQRRPAPARAAPARPGRPLPARPPTRAAPRATPRTVPRTVPRRVPQRSAPTPSRSRATPRAAPKAPPRAAPPRAQPQKQKSRSRGRAAPKKAPKAPARQHEHRR